MKSEIIVILACIGLAVFSNAADSAEATGVLAQITLKSGMSKIGELGRENETHIELLDLVSGESSTFPKTDVFRMNKEVSDDLAAQTLGLATIISWKSSRIVPKDLPSGSIASIDGAILYVTLGSKSGVDRGDKLQVFRGNREIKDPQTGEVLGRQRRKLAVLEVVEVQDKFCKAKQLGDLEVPLVEGDTVEPGSFANAIAVFSPVTARGDVTETGVRISEDLTTALVKRGLVVVERKLLVDALAELALEQTALVDDATAAKVGKLAGAYGVLTGTITSDGKSTRVNLRLVEVETGKIKFAVASSVKTDIGKVIEGGSSKPTGGVTIKKSTASGNKANATAKMPASLQQTKWLSSSATYKVSSQFERARPLPSLLSEDDRMYASVNGVTASAVKDDGYYAFTTKNEPGAFITIDLGRASSIKGVYIRNRMETQAAVERAKDLTMWISEDPSDKGTEVWSTDEAEVEWYVVLEKPVRGRYVTLGFPKSKKEYFHLSKVKVFGQ